MSSGTWIWVAATALVAAAGVEAQPVTCQTAASVTPIVRGEGYSEAVGDVVLSCTGGIPTAPGRTVPQVNLTIFLNANITSKVLSKNLRAFSNGQSAALSEALLLVDEPNSPNSLGVQCGPNGAYNGNSGNLCLGSLSGPPANLSTNGKPYPLLNCGAVVAGQPAAPDGGPSGPGVCSIIAAAGPTGVAAPEHTYDGTAAGCKYWTPPAGQAAYADACANGQQGVVNAPGYGCG